MHSPSRNAKWLAGIGMWVALAGPGSAQTSSEGSPRPKPSAIDNFGFPYGFSTSKMDLAADPRRDFRRHAAGLWSDAATISSDTVRISSIDVVAKRVEAQVGALLDAAASASPAPPKGSPMQQVGDHYAAGMDERRLTELGVRPIEGELARIAATEGRKGLAETLARLSTLTDDAVLFGPVVSTDNNDRRRTAVFMVDAELPLGLDNYLKPEGQKIRDAYRERIAGMLVIAGSAPDEASASAARILAIETRIAGKKLTPLEMRDPAKRFVAMRYEDVRAMVDNVDLDAFFAAMGIPAGGEITVHGAAAMRERNALLADLPPADLEAYLRWELLRRMSPYLTPAFIAPNKVFAEALYGKMDLPPRHRLVAVEVETALGHPLGQLYVASHLSADTRVAAEALVSLVRAEFRERIEKSAWLSPETRREALAKIDAMVVRVGHPTEWIDYTGVDIRRDDYYGNVTRLNEFKTRRNVARLGKPVKEDMFAIPASTLPTVVNAAYQPSNNSIEIPAAFLQPPFYDFEADAAVNFCSLGAVIGHEFTHGFDSMGRLYDAGGNVRDWWTPADAQHFGAEAQKLVRQAAAVEVLPGLLINGELSVGENLADVGGVSLGYAALQRHLTAHPSEDRRMDGLTPAQRCYLSWAQAWADKANEGWLKQVLPVDGHPPGVYRMLAPLQHAPGFYEAFGIRPGDPMWLDPENRVAIW